jgi:hypothetical protein
VVAEFSFPGHGPGHVGPVPFFLVSHVDGALEVDLGHLRVGTVEYVAVGEKTRMRGAPGALGLPGRHITVGDRRRRIRGLHVDGSDGYVGRPHVCGHHGLDQLTPTLPKVSGIVSSGGINCNKENNY